MMRSLYSGVSGMQNHQTRMDVIGNNLANVNTTGFKKGRVNFQDLLSQSQKGAARPNEKVGGVNPQQVGLGMTIATIDTIHTQGSLQTTGVKSDVAILGNGFFVMRNGDTNLYSRNGAFGLDADGFLVNPANGMRLQGWQSEVVGGQTIVNTAKSLEDLKIPVGSKDPAKATSEVYSRCNLDKNTPVIQEGADEATRLKGTWTIDNEIFDTFGNNHRLQINYTRVDGQPNTWRATVNIQGKNNEAIQPRLSIGGQEIAEGNNTFVMKFDNFGTLQSVSADIDAQGNPVGGLDNADNLQVAITYAVPETSVPAGADANNPAFAGRNPGDPILQSFNLNVGQIGSTENSSTQYASASSNKVYMQDGYGMGYLEDYRIDQSGEIIGIYDNGTNRSLGRIALASFTNPGGLEKNGENNYAQTINSGVADIGPSQTAGKGKFQSGALEMSNVDMSETFVDMIVTQRGFQANSKTIQTSDQLLQELLQLKR